MPYTDANPIPEPIPVVPPESSPELDLRSEMLPALGEDKEKALVAEILSDYNSAILDRIDWIDRLSVWEDQYHGNLPEKNFPWPGCSNFHVPLTMMGVENLKPRLVLSILGGNPVVQAKPTTVAREEVRDRVESYLNWQITEEMNLPEVIADSAHMFLLPGTVIAKVIWETDQRRSKAIRKFPSGSSVSTILETLLGKQVPDEFTEDPPGTWSGSIREANGITRQVTIKLKPTETEILALVDREDILYDGPRVYLVPPEDFIVPVNAGGDLQKFHFCMQRHWMKEDTLRRYVARGVFDADAVEELINGVVATGDTETDAQSIQQIRAAAEGVAADGTTNPRDTEYMILEDYRCYDIDDDGFEEEIITWVSPKLPERILGWDYLDNHLAHGLRPFVAGRWSKMPNRFYGLCFAEVVRGIQEEINTIHNMRVDAGTIQNTPGYFYRSSAIHNPTTYRWRPGGGIPIDNPATDIFIPQWNGSPAFGQQEEALLYQAYERLTGQTDVSLGRQPNRVGATRTASGTNALLSEAGLRYETGMRAFQRFWVDIFKHILALDQQYMPPGKEFRVTGRYPEIMRIPDKTYLRGNYKLSITATSETANRSAAREDATVKLNTALNPVALQLQLIGKKGLDRLFREFYRAYGESDPDAIMEPLGDGMVHTPAEELDVLLGGGDIAPSPYENAQMHMAAHMLQVEDPIVADTLGSEAMAKLKRHIAETAALLQTKQAADTMQAQRGRPGAGGGTGGPPIGPQAMNAEMGRTMPNQGGGSGMPMGGMNAPGAG